MTMAVSRPDPFHILPDDKTPESQAQDFVAQRLAEGWLLADLHSFAWGDREDARRAAVRVGPYRYQFLNSVIDELNVLRMGMDIE
jgi:hypothetical protein